jgi:hypothetical protein
MAIAAAGRGLSSIIHSGDLANRMLDIADGTMIFDDVGVPSGTSRSPRERLPGELRTRSEPMNADPGRARREPIGISVVVGAMMLVMLSHANHSLFAWLAFAGALAGLVLINFRYRVLIDASIPPVAAEPAEGMQ